MDTVATNNEKNAGGRGVAQTVGAVAAAFAGASLFAWGLMETTRPPAPKPQPMTRQQEIFIKRHPCPATRKVQTECPGYVVSYVKPLCAGGVDRVSNMLWRTVAEAKKQEREDRKVCAKPSAPGKASPPKGR